MDLGHLVSKDIGKKFEWTLWILSVDCELRHACEDNRGNMTNLNKTAAWKVKCEKQEHTQFLFMKKENVMENQTQEKKRKENFNRSPRHRF